MPPINRRQFGHLTIGVAGWSALASSASAGINSTFSGVVVGVQSYSFRDRSLDEAVKAMADIGIGECELYQGHVEPAGRDRENLRQWRLTVPLDEFARIGKKFRDAGIDLYSYYYNLRDDCTDGEIERGFEMAKALGAKVITSSSNVSTSKRIDPFARKHKMRVGMHNHSRVDPNEFATPDDFAAARKGMSPYIAISLDIGHFVAAGYDPLSFIQEHHADIVTLHIRDRKKNQGDSVPLGQGDTPVKEILQLLRDTKYDIKANIEHSYAGDPVEEVRKAFNYCKQVLLG